MLIKDLFFKLMQLFFSLMYNISTKKTAQLFSTLILKEKAFLKDHVTLKPEVMVAEKI